MLAGNFSEFIVYIYRQTEVSLNPDLCIQPAVVEKILLPRYREVTSYQLVTTCHLEPQVDSSHHELRLWTGGGKHIDVVLTPTMQVAKKSLELARR